MQRKIFLLMGILLLGFAILSKGSITYALDQLSAGNFEKDSSYFFIHYNGEEQEIVINENITLTLTSWTDESKSSVNGKIENHTYSSSQSKDITMDVTDELNELVVTETESIHFRLAVSDSFKVEEVKSLELNDQMTVVAENENGTSIEELETIDENGTVIEKQGLTYYSTDENNQKIVITKESYDSLNLSVDSLEVVESTEDNSLEVVESTEDNSIVSEKSSEEVTEEDTLERVQLSSFRTQSAVESPSIHYATHVQENGWMDFVADGAMSGTEGQAKRLEAIKIDLQAAPYSGGIAYSTHVQDYGWLNNVSNGEVSGTTGQSKRLEAIKLDLTGDIANNYDVYYRVHIESYGWLGWTKNGRKAGSEGLSKRLEAIEIVLVEKGGEAPGSTDKPFLSDKPFLIEPSVVYSTHVQEYGWMDFVTDGAMSGTEGEAKRLEAIKIDLQDAPYSGGITYSTHVQNDGWLNNVSKGQVSGTSGQSKRLEAIKIDLTGDIAKYFDVYYRVHIEGYGWLGWAKNGMKAGSEGLSFRLEAIEIELVPKGQGESVSEEEAFKQAFKQPLTVFLDPGHGGSDPGAIAGGYQEADLNLAVAKKVQSILLNRGYTVYMSRNNDTTVSLLDRSQMANDLGTDIFISIHHNSTGTGATTADGIESYYYQYFADYPPKINADMHNNPERILKSVTLTNLIHENMVDYTGADDRGTAGDTFSVVREAAMPATLLELGFINNASERKKLVTDSYQNKLARAIADGIDEYFTIY